MSTLYEFRLEVSHYNREADIRVACKAFLDKYRVAEFPEAEEIVNPHSETYAVRQMVSLAFGETVYEVSKQFAAELFMVNGKPCLIRIATTYKEDPPPEVFTFGK